jgi:hypothetical protein
MTLRVLFCNRMTINELSQGLNKTCPVVVGNQNNTAVVGLPLPTAGCNIWPLASDVKTPGPFFA